MNITQYNVEDRVAYSRAFMRSTAQYIGWRSTARGTVVDLETFGLARRVRPPSAPPNEDNTHA